MSPNAYQIVAACLALVLLAFLVGARLLYTRVQEMRRKRIHPQAVATSVKMTARLENIQPADNFRNLFEVPVLFFALAAVALAISHTPGWLVHGAWLYVGLRALHSLIHCSYNRVAHRFGVYIVSALVLWVMVVRAFLAAL